MASVTKFSSSAVINQLRHNTREIANNSNNDINDDFREANYRLSPIREGFDPEHQWKSDYAYFKQRKSELYCYGRDDVKVLAGWVITAPKDLPKEQYDDFFKATYDFLENRYGEENTIQAIVHNDESGCAHLHYTFIPVTHYSNDKHPEYEEKICANDVLNRKELQHFHPDLQKYLQDNGIDANVMTGVTKSQGGNITVEELKANRHTTFETQRDWFNEEKVEKSYKKEVRVW